MADLQLYAEYPLDFLDFGSLFAYGLARSRFVMRLEKPKQMAIVFLALLCLIAYFLYVAFVDFNEVA